MPCGWVAGEAAASASAVVGLAFVALAAAFAVVVAVVAAAVVVGSIGFSVVPISVAVRLCHLLVLSNSSPGRTCFLIPVAISLEFVRTMPLLDSVCPS